MCILTAAIFWLFNALNHDYTADLKYPIRIVYDNERLVPVSKLPSYIELNATGYGWHFLRKSLQINQKPIYIKPPELPKKNYITSFDIFPLFSEQMKELKINYFLKDTLYFDFDHSLRKKIYLKTDTTGISLARNHRIIGQIEVKPAYVFCFGAAGKVRELPDTLMIKLPFENIQGDFEENIPIDTFDKSILKFNYSEALVKFIAKRLERKEKMVKVSKENFPSTYRLESDSILLVYYVDPDADPSEEDFKVTADFGRKKRNYVIPEITGYPKYVEDVEIPRLPLLKKK